MNPYVETTDEDAATCRTNIERAEWQGPERRASEAPAVGDAVRAGDASRIRTQVTRLRAAPSWTTTPQSSCSAAAAVASAAESATCRI